MNPFIMNPEGVARFFAIDKMAEGPFPEHYEPVGKALLEAMEAALGIRAEGEKDAVHHMECPVVRRDSVGPPPAHVGKQNRRRASHTTERSRTATTDR